MDNQRIIAPGVSLLTHNKAQSEIDSAVYLRNQFYKIVVVGAIL